jgi:hypothetical protein
MKSVVYDCPLQHWSDCAGKVKKLDENWKTRGMVNSNFGAISITSPNKVYSRRLGHLICLNTCRRTLFRDMNFEHIIAAVHSDHFIYRCDDIRQSKSHGSVAPIKIRQTSQKVTSDQIRINY